MKESKFHTKNGMVLLCTNKTGGTSWNSRKNAVIVSGRGVWGVGGEGEVGRVGLFLPDGHARSTQPAGPKITLWFPRL